MCVLCFVFWVLGFGFQGVRVWGLVVGVWCLAFGVYDLGVGVKLYVWGLRIRV